MPPRISSSLDLDPKARLPHCITFAFRITVLAICRSAGAANCSSIIGTPFVLT